MSNPNNCVSCDHKKHPDNGHCYMFRLEPTNPCAYHTFHIERWRAVRMQRLADHLSKSGMCAAAIRALND